MKQLEIIFYPAVGYGLEYWFDLKVVSTANLCQQLCDIFSMKAIKVDELFKERAIFQVKGSSLLLDKKEIWKQFDQFVGRKKT